MENSTINANKILDKNEINVVIYHNPCSDGFGSAFIVWHYYKTNYLDKLNDILFVPATFLKKDDSLNDEYLAQMTGKNILMCDFSFPYSQLIRLINVSKSFMILDHHKTAEADLKGIPSELKIFDMARSGVGITWDYFYPGTSIPRFLAYIQDRDIWAYKLPKTSEFVTFFYEQEFDFELWEKYLLEDNVDAAIETGTAWIEYQKILIDKIIKRTSYVIQEINNKYAVVLYCNSPDLKSDIGSKVFNKYPIGDFSAVWDYNLYKNQTSYSLRSTNDRFDVSAIAKMFGGGGHRNASGLMLDGMAGYLPLTMVKDPGVLEILLHSSKGTFTMHGEEATFTLFKVKEILSEWMEEKYLDLIKRKTSDSTFVVFETPSEMVNYDPVSTEIKPVKNYNLIFNEYAITNQGKKLQFMVYGNRDQAITFTSDKDFPDVLSDKANEKLDDLEDIEDMDDDFVESD